MLDNYSSPITPTVGRVVLVRGGGILVGEPDREVPALVTRVWGDNTINAQVFNEVPGGTFMSSLAYFDDMTNPVPYAAWRWMPYQVAMAKTAEQADPTPGLDRATGVWTPPSTTTGSATTSAERENLAPILFDFGLALHELWADNAVSRVGWNGKGMWLRLQRPDAHSKMSLPYLYMSTADGKLVPWLASQTDVLADDWMILS